MSDWETIKAERAARDQFVRVVGHFRGRRCWEIRAAKAYKLRLRRSR